VVVQLPDGTLCALPTWMTDPSVCAVMLVGPPVASCEALLELRGVVARLLGKGGALSDGARFNFR